jgi:hypothetical protein
VTTEPDFDDAHTVCLAMSILTPARPGFPARLLGIVSGTNLEYRYCTPKQCTIQPTNHQLWHRSISIGNQRTG